MGNEGEVHEVVLWFIAFQLFGSISIILHYALGYLKELGIYVRISIGVIAWACSVAAIISLVMMVYLNGTI